MNALPDGWDLKTLGEVCDLYQPKTVARKDFVSDGLYPVYGANGEIGRLNRYNHAESEVLLSCRGNCGTVNMSKPMAWINGNAMVCHPKDRLLDKRFLAFQLESIDWSPIISGTAQQQITRGPLSEVEVVIPPLDEQQRIVATLEAHLSRLDVATKGVGRAFRLVQSLRESILAAAFTGRLISNGEIWSTAILADVAKWSSGGTPSSSNKAFYGGEIPWVVIGDLTESWVEITEKSITEAGLAASATRLLPRGTVMLAMYGASIGRTGKMATDMTTNQAIACAIVNEDVLDPNFLLFYLQSQKKAFIAAGQGGAQPNISQRIVKAWPIQFPDLEKQRQIVEVIDQAFSTIEHLRQQVSITDARIGSLRRSLLTSAFSGQLTKDPSLV